MSSAQGEDRSNFQAVGPWTGLDFGWCKATEGLDYSDPAFPANWAALKNDVGHRGAYHFFHPSLSVTDQAAFFMSAVTAHGLQRGDMLAIDAEISAGLDGTLLMHPAAEGRSALLQPGRKGRAVIQPGVTYPHRRLRTSLPAKLVSTLVGSAAFDFLAEVQTAVRVSLGGDYCPVVLYTYLDFLPELGQCTSYPLWIAAYAADAPVSVAPWTTWTMWQYQGGGGQYGADQDAFNGTRAAMDTWAATYAGKPAPPAQNWTETLVQELPELYNGTAGNDVKTVQGCLNARGYTVAVDGIYGPATVAAVRGLQASKALVQDGIAGPLTWAALLNR